LGMRPTLDGGLVWAMTIGRTPVFLQTTTPVLKPYMFGLEYPRAESYNNAVAVIT
jgi:hypothetical protein